MTSGMPNLPIHQTQWPKKFTLWKNEQEPNPDPPLNIGPTIDREKYAQWKQEGESEATIEAKQLTLKLVEDIWNNWQLKNRLSKHQNEYDSDQYT